MNFRAFLAASAVIVGSVAFQVSPAFAALSNADKLSIANACAGNCANEIAAAAAQEGLSDADVSFLSAQLAKKAVAGKLPATYTAAYNAVKGQAATRDPQVASSLDGVSTGGTGAGGVAGGGGATGGKQNGGISPVSPLAKVDKIIVDGTGSPNT